MTLALRLAADAVALFHLGFVLFVVFGGLLGLSLAPAGLAPPAGAGVGGVDRIRRRAVSADPVGESPPPSRRPSRLRRGLHRSLSLAAALPGGTDPRGAVGAGGRRPRLQPRGLRRALDSPDAPGAVAGAAAVKATRATAGRSVRSWRGLVLALLRAVGPATGAPFSGRLGRTPPAPVDSLRRRDRRGA